MQRGRGDQAFHVIVDQAVGQAAFDVLGHEGVERQAHVDIRLAGKIDQQREAAQIAVAVVIALVGPDGIGHQFAVQRQRQRPGTDADDFGRIPVRHDAKYGGAPAQEGMGLLRGADLVGHALQLLVVLGIGHALLHQQRPRLQQIQVLLRPGQGEFDVQRAAREQRLQLVEQGQDFSHLRRHLPGAAARHEGAAGTQSARDRGRVGTQGIVDDAVGRAGAGIVAEGHAGHGHLGQHGLHQHFVLGFDARAVGGQHGADGAAQRRLTAHVQHRRVVAGHGGARQVFIVRARAHRQRLHDAELRRQVGQYGVGVGLPVAGAKIGQRRDAGVTQCRAQRCQCTGLGRQRRGRLHGRFHRR